MTAPSFVDLDGEWSKRSGLGNVPSFLVVGRDGAAVYRSAGRLTEGTPEFEALADAIEAALRAEKGASKG